MRALVFSATRRDQAFQSAQASVVSSNAFLGRRAPVQLVDDWTIARGSTGGSGTVLFEDRSQSRDASEIISYQPALARDGVIVWYAGFADHVNRVSQWRGSRATQGRTHRVQNLKRHGAVPARQTVADCALIKRIVNARVAEHEAKARR